jgi:hypothetical protein
MAGWSSTCRSTIRVHQAYYEWNLGVPRRDRANSSRRYILGLSQPLLSIIISTYQKSCPRIGPNGRYWTGPTSLQCAQLQHKCFQPTKQRGFLNNPSDRFFDTTLPAPQLESSPALQLTTPVNGYKYVPKVGPRISDST